jgi:arylsulfatase A
LTKSRDVAERYWDPLIEENGKVLHQELKGKYGPDHFCDYICNYIERNSKHPFFIYYPMVLTHSPFIHTPDSSSTKLKSQQAFADMVVYMDKIVGRIIAKLEALKLMENTIVIFTGDNGTHQRIKTKTVDGTVKGGKSTMPDAGTRVPLIVLWKGKTPAGTVSRDLVDFSDFFSTFADAGGVSVTPDMGVDGRSFLPQLKGEKGNPRNWVFCHYQPFWAYGNKNQNRFVRTQQYKLYVDGRFYDVPADVLEKECVDMLTGQVELKKARKEELQKVLDSMPKWQRSSKTTKNKKGNTTVR